MNKYRVQAVYVGCVFDEATADTYEQALAEEQRMTEAYIEAFGEANYQGGLGDFNVTIEEIEM